MNDTVYRKDVIDTMEKIMADHPIDGYEDECQLINAMKSLPSAQLDGIPLEWIDKHLEWLDNCDNDFAQLAKVSIRAMVEIWKKDKT